MHFAVAIYHTSISKFPKFKKFKNSPVRSKKSISQMNDTILDACMKFENYPIKTVGEDVFHRHYMLYHCFKN